MSQPRHQKVHLSPGIIGCKMQRVSMSVYAKWSQKYFLYIAWFLEQPERTWEGMHPLCGVLNKCITDKAHPVEADRSLFFVKCNLPEAGAFRISFKQISSISKNEGEKKRFSIVELFWCFLKIRFFRLECLLLLASFNLWKMFRLQGNIVKIQEFLSLETLTWKFY